MNTIGSTIINLTIRIPVVAGDYTRLSAAVAKLSNITENRVDSFTSLELGIASYVTAL